MNFINREDPKAFVTIYNVSSMHYWPKLERGTGEGHKKPCRGFSAAENRGKIRKKRKGITAMDIRLICSDIDGTLLQYGKKKLEERDL